MRFTYINNLLILFLTLSFITACNSEGSHLPKQAEQQTNIIGALILPASSSLPIGLSEQLTAEITMLDGRVKNITQANEVNWISSDETIVSVSNDHESKGKITGLSQGNATITVSGTDNGQLINGTAQIEVTNLVVTQLQVTAENTSLPIGLSKNLVAEVTLSNGQVIDVTHDPLINWSSDNDAIASVNNEGKVTGHINGVVSITASGIANGQSFQGVIELVVTDSVVVQLNVEATEIQLPIGLSEKLRAIAVLSNGERLDVTNNDAIQWSSSDVSTAKVENSGPNKGKLTGIAVGTVTITASGVANGTAFTGRVQIEVTDAVVSTIRITQNQISLAVGLTRTLFAEATMSDGEILDISNNSALSWSSSDPSIASISNSENSQGELSALAPGLTTITAVGVANGHWFSDSIEVEITNAVVTRLTVSTPDSSVPSGLNLFLTAKVILSDGEVVTVTDNDALSWRSSDLTIASISNHQTDKGKITGIRPGVVSITASGTANDQYFSDTIEITITDPILQRIELNTSTVRITEHFDIMLQAVAIYSDGHSYDATTKSQWHSDSTNLSILDGTLSTINLIDGQEAHIIASYLGITSDPVSVIMVDSEASSVIGSETAYTDDISADLHQQLKFRGGTIINGIYDVATNVRLGGGTGTYSEDSSPFFADQMSVNHVLYLKGFVGTIRGEENQLQVLEWDEGTLKSVGKWYSRDWSEVFIHNEILGVIVHKSSPEQAAYIKGMQFIYR